ncbi:hypothetical protein I545_3313 [Mycobacterium kansasii 662]|uniref:Mce associated membrane protein n=2 Tax=Mycobacterium TaxID=1763 RepID=A0A498R301_9MYCO|nr:MULTISPECIES: hypothetical protein [Mycobacterium]KZS63029.1 hypothetical protein A4G27_09115 [Mycobacterium kansasii]EUA17603.1 hypothetical protein I545_3313 [Mycobacterium kansasii 662]MBY0388288.1 hypothetical protein [Mycobacterium pseudokansasii]VBA30789.1 hypothetical protein LAUMK35_04843 [Mycobacterium pseudokansasii]VBA32612.1 hypothetical protein LAUMK21_04833 [Mycobacterium pseudokansasii]
MSAGRDQNAADTRSVLVSDDETASTAAELRALAEQAEAEAAEAEALAAAARARARAIQLRRRAEVADGADEGPVAEEDPATEEVHAEVSKGEPDNSETTVVPETIEAERGSDVEDEDRDADVSAAADEALPRRRRRPRLTRSTVAAALAAIVILVALSASVYMVVQHRDAIRHRERVAEFAAAARQGVVTLTSLDFTNAKQGVQRILDNSTGAFRDDMAKVAADFIKVVEQSKVVEQGTVQAVAVDVDTMTDDSAVVLVASTSEVTNAAGAKQDPRKFRLIVTITRDGDQLKMSKVEFVP